VQKLRVAFAAGASCAGCDAALVDLCEGFLSLADGVEFVFWPIALDFKLEDLRRLEEVDVVMYAGAVRTDEQEEIAKLLRKKAKVVVAVGSCACFGGVPSLANLYTRSDIIRTVYGEEEAPGAEGVLDLPILREWCDPLDRVVEVDVYVPGCPPQESVWERFAEILGEYARTGSPPRRVFAAEEKSICDTCPRSLPEEISLDRFYRIHEVRLDEEKCFLQQGVLCLGPVTRKGCGEVCTRANAPCWGCMGPVPEVRDPGAKFVSTIATILHAGREGVVGEEGLRKALEGLQDLVGSLYTYLLPLSTIERLRRREWSETPTS